MLKKLSIIMPYHNSLELTKKLLAVLVPQLTDECEFIIIDDDVNTYELDSYKNDNVRVIHHEVNSGCAGKPRNTGLDNKTKGTPYVFVDSDDLVVENYINKIIDKINTSIFDYCLFSWKFNGIRSEEVIIEDEAPEWNLSCWNCIYTDDTIRFDETMKVAEDYDFNLRARKDKKENIVDILYLYNDNRKDSLMWEALNGGGNK